MSEIMTYPISEAVTLKSFIDPSFKTMRVSVNMLLPLSQSTAAKYAILPSLISRATQEYPDYTALGRRLAELYGASLGSGVQRIGEYQALGLSVSGIASRYAFGGEDMFAQLTGLMFSVLFDPLKDEAGLFPLDGFTQEKRQQLEQKDAEFSDKMLYAHQRCHELLFEGKPAGVDRLGTREDIEALTRESLAGAWEELLAGARFEIFALGDCQPDVDAIREKFAQVGHPHKLGPVAYEKPTLRRVTDRQPVAQSKLTMAFRARVPMEERLLFQLMSAVLGEPTSSKLFQNVREKQSLCYYCDSAFSWVNNALFIESGVETENLDRAEEAILDQLTALQKGEVTEDELRHAQLYMCNGLRSVRDTLHRVEGWYLSRSFDQPDLSPEQAADILMKYTVDDVVQAANRLQPAVIYQLKGAESDETAKD